MEQLMSAAGPLGLVVLALIDSTSVGTLVIPLMMLVGSAGPARRVAGRTVLYLLAIGAFYWVLGVLLLAGLLPLLERAQGLLATPAASVLLAAIGAALVVWSYRSDPATIRKRGGDPEASSRRWAERVQRAADSLRLLVGLALLAGVVEAASMIPYLAAMGILADMGVGLGGGAVILMGYCAVMIAPGLLLAGARMLAGSRADALLGRIHTWAIRNAASAFSWAVGIIGVLILLRTLGPALGVLTALR
ncbi:GAP family protein [Brachybacterium hainanense]|uniref:GAP family protein n=1 Tax=Brachybacterium hainanense TaxID=1541174 RepID=A0ABV6RD25_9MICO